MLTATQRGTAGEQLFAACVTLSSDGELELFKPLTDDDHTDISAGHRGGVPALAIQVKTALTLDKKKLAVARMSFPEGAPREHPAFVYAVLYVPDLNIESAWLVPSADFNHLCYRGLGRRGKGIELQFMASPSRDDHWASYRCTRFALGQGLIALINALPAGKPQAPWIPGTHLLLRR